MNQQQTQAAKVNVHGLGQHYNLGNFKREYKTLGWYCLLPLFIIATIAFSSFFMIAMVVVMQVTHIPLEIQPAIVGVFIVCVLLLIIGGTYRVLTMGRLHAYLYDDGFIYRTSKGIVERVVRWTDVIAFRHSVSEGMSRSDGSRSRTDIYTVTLRNKREPVELCFGT